MFESLEAPPLAPWAPGTDSNFNFKASKLNLDGFSHQNRPNFFGCCSLSIACGNLSAVLVRLKSLTGRAHQTTYKMVAVANEAKNRGDDCEITYNMPIGL